MADISPPEPDTYSAGYDAGWDAFGGLRPDETELLLKRHSASWGLGFQEGWIERRRLAEHEHGIPTLRLNWDERD